MRPLLLACLAALGLATPVAAQVEGRWALMLGGGVTGRERGELILQREGGDLEGSIWLASSEAPARLSRLRAEGDTLVEFRAPGPLQFRGVLRGDVLSGVARDGDEARPWQAARLATTAEFYPVLPRFTLRQLVLGRADDSSRIPGAWVGAARAAGGDDSAAYARLATAAGLAPLSGAALTDLSAARARGRVQRDELRAAVGSTLGSIERQIPLPAARAVFNRLFRPRGQWLMDAQDAAQAFAEAAAPGITPLQAVPALAAAGWIDGERSHTPAEVADALYRLRVLAQSDTALAQVLRLSMRRAAPGSAPVVEVYLGAWEAAERWHAGVLRWLLEAPWIGGGGPPSVAARMQAAWAGLVDSVPMPVVRARHFGHPQAVPRYGIPAPLFARMVQADNWSAGQWLDRHGQGALLDALRLLPFDFGDGATLEQGDETLLLSTVRRQAEARDNGFLEAHDAIEIDPSYVPLLAFGAAVHEWEHLVFERARRLRSSAGEGDIVTLQSPDPYIAEGVAEWRTARLLDSIAARFPLLAMGEHEKRLRLAAASRDEPHALGYLLVRALAQAVPDPARRMTLLLAASDEPAAALRGTELERAWGRWRGTAPLERPASGRRVLLPELTFTVEDGFPDILRFRILDEAP